MSPIKTREEEAPGIRRQDPKAVSVSSSAPPLKADHAPSPNRRWSGSLGRKAHGRHRLCPQDGDAKGGCQ